MRLTIGHRTSEENLVRARTRSKDTVVSTGLLMVYTGDEKAGTAAVLGQAFRALGRGLRVCIINFAPGLPLSPELIWPERGRGVMEVHDLNQGPTPNARARGKEGYAEPGLRLVKDALTSGRFDMVVLSDIAALTSKTTAKGGRVIDILRSRPEGLHLLVTGQDVPDEIIAEAHLVTGARASGALT